MQQLKVYPRYAVDGVCPRLQRIAFQNIGCYKCGYMDKLNPKTFELDILKKVYTIITETNGTISKEIPSLVYPSTFMVVDVEVCGDCYMNVCFGMWDIIFTSKLNGERLLTFWRNEDLPRELLNMVGELYILVVKLQKVKDLPLGKSRFVERPKHRDTVYV